MGGSSGVGRSRGTTSESGTVTTSGGMHVAVTVRVLACTCSDGHFLQRVELDLTARFDQIERLSKRNADENTVSNGSLLACFVCT